MSKIVQDCFAQCNALQCNPMASSFKGEYGSFSLSFNSGIHRKRSKMAKHITFYCLDETENLITGNLNNLDHLLQSGDENRTGDE